MLYRTKIQANWDTLCGRSIGDPLDWYFSRRLGINVAELRNAEAQPEIPKETAALNAYIEMCKRTNPDLDLSDLMKRLETIKESIKAKTK